MNNEKSKIVVCGANGFTGRFICEELLLKNYDFIAILRPGSETGWMDMRNIKYKFADLKNQFQLEKVINGNDILISAASIAFGNVPSIINASKKVKINRTIFISSTAIYTKLNAKSKKARLSAELMIKKSNLDWTIIRPTMIYGTPNDRNIIKLIKWIDKYPILPVFGNGNFLQQPIHVKDVAKVIIDLIENKNSFIRCFNIAGANPITFNEMIKIIKLELRKKCLTIFLPANIVVFLLKILEFLKLKIPIKSEQVQRLNEHKSFSYNEAEKLLNFSPICFKEGIKYELEIYKKNLKNKI